MGIVIGKRPVADFTNDELSGWILGKCERAGRRIKADTVPVWVAVLRGFDQNGTPATVRQTFYILAQ